jgi:aminoglycoside phosphotransferase (APT) family kinase protein
VERQIRRWRKQYEATRTRDVPEMEKLADWLAVNVPDNDEASIVHGDFRLQNLLFHPQENRVVAVLDWELSTLGHPLTDLAYNCMVYRFAAADEAFPGVGGIDLEGIPEESEYIAAYCRRTGRAEIGHWPFYMAFSLYRMAAILQGVYARALQGNASSENAIAMEPMVGRLAEAGWRSAQGDS